MPRSLEERVVHRIADRSVKIVKAEFIRSVIEFADLIPEESISHLFSLNMTRAIETVIPFEQWWSLITKNMSERLRDTYREAVDSVFVQKADFDTSPEDPDVLHHLNSNLATLVTEISEEHKKVIRDIIIRSRTQDVTDRELISTIKRATGLRTDQVLASESFRVRLLEKGLSDSVVESRVKSFEKRMLSRRADMIARTETMNAANEGQQIGWEKASRAGSFDRSRAKLEWVTAQDDLVCPTCAPMNGVKRPFNGVWKVVVRNIIVKNGKVVGAKATGVVKTVKIPNKAHPNCRCVAKLII